MAYFRERFAQHSQYSRVNALYCCFRADGPDSRQMIILPSLGENVVNSFVIWNLNNVLH